MTRSLSPWQAIVLGAALLFSLGLACVGLFALGSHWWPWRDTLDVRVGFKQARGVALGTRVRIQGVDAGEVVGLDPPATPGGDVLLTLRLDNRRLRSRDLVRRDAVAQIVSEGMVGGKVIDIDPGTIQAPPIEAGAVLAARPTIELNDAIAQAGALLKAMEEQKGKVGELVENSNRLLSSGHEAVTSIRRVSEAVEDAPLVRSYVKDPQKLLMPPGTDCKPWWFSEIDLFEPGSDRLTTDGRKRLETLVAQVAGLTQHEGSEVVVVAYADPKSADKALAKRLTQNQSETAGTYLKERGAVYKKYWVFSRKVTALGLGTDRPPLPEREKLPPAGLGVLVFVPQS